MKCPAKNRRKRSVAPVHLRKHLSPFSPNLYIFSFNTTVRRRPDRSRPPQVGAAAHTCTESADKTAPAGHCHPSPQNLPELPSAPATRPARTPPPRRGRSRRRNQGGPGGIISPGGVRGGPVAPVCLPSTQSRAAPRGSGYPSSIKALDMTGGFPRNSLVCFTGEREVRPFLLPRGGRRGRQP